MKKMSIFASCMLLFFLFGSASYGAVIVDTGPTPSSFAYSSSFGNNGTYFDYLAAQFSTSETFTITDIQGFMYRGYGDNDEVNAIIYENYYSDYIGAYVPGNHLYSATFKIGYDQNWYGPSGLSWELAPGTYWVGFEPLVGCSGTMPVPFPNPLPLEAFYVSANVHPWGSHPGVGLGLRIYDNAVVPLPPSALLLGTGLVGLLALGGRRRRRQE